MAYTTTSTTSYGGRLGNALKGILFGIIAFLIGTILLVWNEGNHVKTKRAINEAQSAAVEMGDINQLDPALNGKLVHASGLATTDEVLEDARFGVRENAITLERRVEFYQYEERANSETKDKLGGGQETITTYTYKPGWQREQIDSSEFHDPAYQGKNFALIDLAGRRQSAKSVRFGAYTLPDFFIQAIGGPVDAKVNLEQDQQDAWEKSMRQPTQQSATQAAGETPAANGENTATTGENEAPAQGDRGPKRVHASGSSVYFGQNPDSPQIGDVKVTFLKVSPKEVSLIGTVNGTSFGRYVAKNGKTFSRLELGQVGAADMFAGAQRENKLMGWVLRAVGVVMVILGLRMIFGIFEALAKVVPFFGRVVGAGVGLVCTVLGLVWSLIWIALAWIAYRPMVGVPLMLAAGALLGWLVMKSLKSKKTALQEA